MSMYKEGLRRIVLWTMLVVAAILGAASLAHAEEEYLDPEIAFQFSARMADEQTIEVRYAIADGYYMYRERFAFRAEGATLGEPTIPPGKIKFDDTFQKDVETYRQSVTITLPVQAEGAFTLIATSQGCADKGLCYSPMDSKIKLSPKGGLLAAILPQGGRDRLASDLGDGLRMSAAGADAASALHADSEMGRIERSLKSGKLLAIVPLFVLLGLGLSFTPCVLPMVPILSYIIVGEGERTSRGRGLALAATYSLGMALVYTGLGIAAGLIGEGLSAALQKPWVLITFALLMLVFSLSMFGVYQLQVPAAIQARLAALSERQSRGKLFGVFAMGAISALIVGPCVAAPLAGALLYISQTRDVVVGGSALFAMAVGMSVPLLLVGFSAGALLPRAGAWMEAVKRFFGVLLLGLALWMVAPVIPASAQMLGWGVLGIGYGAYLLRMRQWGWMAKVFALLFLAFGVAQIAGVASGGRDAWAPLAHLRGSGTEEVSFVRVKSESDLDAAIAGAKGKTVMLDFYADWCVSCKEMEKFTFVDSRIQEKFADMVLLQADVTANDEHDKALLKRFRLFGPPGIIFFDKDGREIPGGRVIGYQDADKFLRSLTLASEF